MLPASPSRSPLLRYEARCCCFRLLLLVVNFLILLMLQVTCGAAAAVPTPTQMLAPTAGACMTAAKLEMNWSTVGISGNGNSCYCIVVK